MSKPKKNTVFRPAHVELETFRRPHWAMQQLRQDNPDCFNEIVSVHKWRIVAERIEEPKEVIYARLLKLWRESNNHHDMRPLEAAASAIGRELPIDEYGADRHL